MTAARDHLEQAQRTAEDPVTRARALAISCQFEGPGHRDRSTMAHLMATAVDELGDRDRELALRLQAWTLFFGRAEPGHAASVKAGAALAGDTPGEAVVLAHLVFLHMRPGARADEVAALAERAARQVDALIEDGTASLSFSGMALGLRWADRMDAAERVIDRAITVACRRGSAIDYGIALGLRASVYLRRGMLGEAEADARAAIAAGVEESWHFARGVGPLLESLAAQGRTDDAMCTLETEIGDREISDLPAMTAVVLAQAQVYAACGDHAIAIFEDAVTRRNRIDPPSASWIGDMLTAGESYQALGNAETAQSLVAEALALARAWGTPGALGEVRHAQARLGPPGDRIELLRDSVELLERSPARLVHARALVDLGGALRRAGHRSDSRDPLRAGYEMAKRCRAERLAETARQELATSGVRLRRERLTGAESLTPSERRIADFAAAGSSNAEIAQALFVTIKTVEAHLTQIYRKLDITSRRDLGRALGTLSIPRGSSAAGTQL